MLGRGKTDKLPKGDEMSTIMLYRRKAGKTPHKGTKALEAARKRINKTVRVKRDELVTFMLSGDFGHLPVTPQSVIDSPIRREEAIGYELPKECLGRKGVANPSQVESVRLWVKKNLMPEGVNPDTVSIVLVTDNED